MLSADTVDDVSSLILQSHFIHGSHGVIVRTKVIPPGE